MTAVDMITSELDRPATAQKNRIRSIVVASDGTDAALAALSAAKLIVDRNAGVVNVLSVLEPIPVVFPPPDGFLLTPELERSREEAQKAIVSDQIAKFDSKGEWGLDLSLGRPAEVIVEFAKAKAADLIIVGLNKHGVWGRIFGEETAIEIARLSGIPLLVASSAMKRLPQRVIVAMDLNQDGLQCAPASLATIADTPSISCVHAKPRSEFLGIDWAEFDRGYELAMRERFSKLEKELEPAHLRPDLIVLHGDPAREIIDFADFSKAELIVVGVKRRAGRSRAVGGRMATRMLRKAECSVLIVPNIMPGKSSGSVSFQSTDVVRDSRLWSSMLRDFTSRNAGRVASLEVDDPEIGALIEAIRYPVLGVDFDHKDNRLTISLGPTHGVERHLTRTIVKPESVSILSVDGRDSALSVAHGTGQTLLWF